MHKVLLLVDRKRTHISISSCIHAFPPSSRNGPWNWEMAAEGHLPAIESMPSPLPPGVPTTDDAFFPFFPRIGFSPLITSDDFSRVDLVWAPESLSRYSRYNVAKLLRHDGLKSSSASEAHCETGVLNGAIWLVLKVGCLGGMTEYCVQIACTVLLFEPRLRLIQSTAIIFHGGKLHYLRRGISSRNCYF